MVSFVYNVQWYCHGYFFQNLLTTPSSFFGVSYFVTNVVNKESSLHPPKSCLAERYLFGWYESKIACETDTIIEYCKEQISLETLPLSGRNIKTTILNPGNKIARRKEER